MDNCENTLSWFGVGIELAYDAAANGDLEKSLMLVIIFRNVFAQRNYLPSISYQLQSSTDLIELRYIDIVPKDDFVKLVVLLRVHNFAHLSEMRVITKARSGRR